KDKHESSQSSAALRTDMTAEGLPEEKRDEGEENAREVDWSWDAATDLLTLGPDTARAFGLTPGTIVTWEKLRESLHPEDRERTQKALREALETGGDYQIDYRVRRGAGYAWIAARGQAT